MTALNNKNFDINNKDHIIVVLGDLLDRGPKSIECLQFVNNLPLDRKILIRGNHEDLLETCMKNGYFRWHDYSNGTVNTVEQISSKDLISKMDMDLDQAALNICKNNRDLKDYFNCLVDYYELENNIFCHGWLPFGVYEDDKQEVNYGIYPDWRTASKQEWDRARWDNGMKAWNIGYKLEGKTIYCGHWHSSWGHCKIDKICSEYDEDADFSPFIKDGIVAIDACTAHSGIVNVVTLCEQGVNK